MKAWRPRWIGAAVAIALLVSLLAVTPALADDTLPPADPPPAEAVADEESPAVAPPLEEPAAEPSPEAAPAEQPTEPVPLVGPTAPELAAPPADELLAQIPDGTTVAVVGEAGEVLPLASAEAAEVLATGDPVWCPTGAKPGAATCSDNYDTLSALVAGFVPTASGVIWIRGGVDSSASPVTIDGSGSWSGASTFALTLQGGWDGPGFTTIDTGNPSVFSVPLSVVGWQAAVTLNDIVIDGVPGPGLYVDVSGPVTLNRVKVRNSGSGAQLDTTGGTGGVVVNDSEFTDSTADMGLGVWSNGAITLKDITATGNAGDGAYLDNLGGAAAPISLTGVNIFAENGTQGLIAWSNGSITASHVVANVNGGWGAYLANHTAATPLPVTLTGFNEFKHNGAGIFVASRGAITLSNLTAASNDFEGVILENDSPGAIGDVKVTGYLKADNNGDDGIQVESSGAITLANVSANNNGLATSGGYGAYLDNSAAPAAKPITLTGTNVYSGNYLTGLVALSKGAISVNALTASWNEDGGGAVLNNIASGPAAPQKITLTGKGTFDDNGGDGLGVHGYGAITIASLTARRNGGGGADIRNWRADATKPMAVSLSGSTSLEDNGLDGLYITSLGAITVANLTSSWNGGYGAYLDNDFFGAKGAVSVNGTSYFGNNDGSGLMVYSLGNIVVQDFDSNENGLFGAYLHNGDLGAIGNVTVGTSRAHWCNGVWDNLDSGLEVYSLGSVTLTSICAEGNGAGSVHGYGVAVNNQAAAGPKPIMLKGNNRFNDNYSGGLSVITRGAISGNNLEAYDNTHGHGVYLDNLAAGPSAPQNVTQSGYTNFGGNSLNGLTINTYGAVTVSDVYSDGNGGSGVEIDNLSGATAPRPVTINGYLTAYDNGAYGVHVTSLGAIKAANLDLWGNFVGGWLNNGSGSAVGGVMLTGNAFVSESDDYGLSVTSRGPITFTLSDAYIGNNGTYGWYLDNSMAATPQAVKLSVSSGNDIDFWENGSYGIWVRSKGAITTTSLTSEENGGFGAYLTNNLPGAAGGITLAGTWSRFNGNDAYGLWAESLGPIAVKVSEGLRGSYNGGWGARLENILGAAPITLGPGGVWGSSFGDNGEEGLILRSRGAVTLTDLDANGNGAAGVDIDNTASGSGSPQNVTLNVGGGFFNNLASGLQVTSYGAITLNNVIANNNGLGGSGHGAQLNNNPGGGVSARPVTLNGTSRFTDNASNGLWIQSLGAIKANNLTAGWNGIEGAYLDNQWGAGSIGGVTLTGLNEFNENDGQGLVVYSHGAITLSNITASHNDDTGAYLDTHGLVAPQKVTLSGTNAFNNNGDEGLHLGSGLEVWADGLVSLSNLTANWNADRGAVLDNEYYAGGVPGAITLGGMNTFMGNYDDGLYFLSLGPVFLSHVTADANGDDGIDGWSDGAVELSCASLTHNGYAGWYMGSATSLILRGVHAFGNTIINDYWYGPTPPVYFRSCP